MEENKIECQIGTPIPEEREAAPKCYWLPPLTGAQLQIVKRALAGRQRHLCNRALRASTDLNDCLTRNFSADLAKSYAAALACDINESKDISFLQMLLDHPQEVSEEDTEVRHGMV